MARHDLRYFPVGQKIAVGECSEDDRPVDAGLARPLQVAAKRSGGVGRLREPVAFSGVTMAVDDHGQLAAMCRSDPDPPRPTCPGRIKNKPAAADGSFYVLSRTSALPRRHHLPELPAAPPDLPPHARMRDLP